MGNLLALPEDDEILIFRADAHQYGFPVGATLAKWASLPSEAPCELPYTQVGRKVAYRVGDLRRLREAMTYRHSAARAAARARKTTTNAEAA